MRLHAVRSISSQCATAVSRLRRYLKNARPFHHGKARATQDFVRHSQKIPWKQNTEITFGYQMVKPSTFSYNKIGTPAVQFKMEHEWRMSFDPNIKMDTKNGKFKKIPINSNSSIDDFILYWLLMSLKNY